jgi:hypothetical protein
MPKYKKMLKTAWEINGDRIGNGLDGGRTPKS